MFHLIFVRTYLCESEFSNDLMMKTIYRSQVDLESELRWRLAKIAAKIN